MSTIIRFALIQNGYCVFGAGGTRLGALRDARRWLEPDNGPVGSMTLQQVEDLLDNRRVDGSFSIIERDDDPSEFDSYMRAQGGFTQSARGNWRAT